MKVGDKVKINPKYAKQVCIGSSLIRPLIANKISSYGFVRAVYESFDKMKMEAVLVEWEFAVGRSYADYAKDLVVVRC